MCSTVSHEKMVAWQLTTKTDDGLPKWWMTLCSCIQCHADEWNKRRRQQKKSLLLKGLTSGAMRETVSPREGEKHETKERMTSCFREWMEEKKNHHELNGYSGWMCVHLISILIQIISKSNECMKIKVFNTSPYNLIKYLHLLKFTVLNCIKVQYKNIMFHTNTLNNLLTYHLYLIKYIYILLMNTFIWILN